ncbi:hypothetical protein GTZ99_08055 [Novosphingobium sp. FSY-8]|uniref:Dolichyl-phosphate-mannose-protein mannosyltransferase n=1 Tax=Novosphingobium ovatum TaxID=1908523 RepID=A0ABW9XD74_9SPHN|nr:hypothetical protein [Novosphingobium ovatum]NBC36507.1 hypothetical protein [Novosphingobium ovatum]
MTHMPDITGFSPAATAPRTAAGAISIGALLVFALALRVTACFALPQTLQSDGLAYFTIAQHMAQGQWATDNMGQHAFYSIGYPLVLTPFFALFGAKVAVAIVVNLGLALISGLMLVRVARDSGLSALGQKLALLAYALWLPGIWNGTMLARENLSTPLILALVWIALRIAQSGPRLSLALAAGAVWGGALLAGTSALMTVAAPALALAVATRWRVSAMLAPLCALALGAGLVVSPWLYATHQMLGHATLSTNSGFNLYVGNNDAATGRFVSIAATPVGPQWKAMRADLGEMGATSALGRAATQWIIANPERVVALGLTKLGLFWAPNLPDRADFAASRTVALIRMGEVAQYLLFVGLGAFGLWSGALAGRARAILLMAISGFWGLHAAAYIIERYRDPIMPLVMVLAAGVLSDILTRRIRHNSAHTGAQGEASHAA